jgi:hypothetical protein
MSAFLTSFFVLSETDMKIEQHVCIKFCVKLSKSATETHEMLWMAFWGLSLSQAAVFEWHSCFKAGQVSAEVDERSGWQKMLIKFEDSYTKIVTKQSMNSQTPLGSVMEFARRSEQKIWMCAAFSCNLFPSSWQMIKSSSTWTFVLIYERRLTSTQILSLGS